jgi:glycosyltransferase involved in cell wall biosynthesis
VQSFEVSALLSTYNRNDLLLGRSLRSVREQSHPVSEIHIVADGMVDPEWAELRTKLAMLGDERIQLHRVPRQSYPEDPGQRWAVVGLNARNYALDCARGEWLAPLDDDDEWSLDHIQVLLDAVRQEKADFAYGESLYHWPDEHFQKAGRWPPGMGSFCDGAQLYRNGMGYRYDPECIARGLPEDGDMWERMVAGGVKFTYVGQVVHHYWVNQR